eukprot:2966410-Rhodomonas_salina.1
MSIASLPQPPTPAPPSVSETRGHHTSLELDPACFADEAATPRPKCEEERGEEASAMWSARLPFTSTRRFAAARNRPTLVGCCSHPRHGYRSH